MSDPKPKRKRGRPPGRSEAPRVSFTLPQDHFDYLKHLAVEKKRFGDTPNDAAKFILIRELDLMYRDGFHKKGTTD